MWSLRVEAIAGLVLVGLLLWGVHASIVWVLPFILQYGLNAMAGVIMVIFGVGVAMGGSSGRH